MLLNRRICTSMKESKKFAELMRTDESFQAKLKAAVETYSGEKTEESVFNDVLLPVAKEYDISVSYEEFKEYMSNLANTDEIMDKDELTQIVGGKGHAGAIDLLTVAGE